MTGDPVIDRAASASDAELLALVEETRQMNELVEAFMPNVPEWDTAEGLRILRENAGFFPHAPVDDVEQRDLPGPTGSIPARVITPEGGPRVDAVYLDIHGGGWCIGAAEGGDAHNRELADAAGTVVVSIDYRLAPEHPFPAGPDDCEAAAVWLLDNMGSEWGASRLVIGGGSAGAHLGAVTLLRLRDRHDAIERVAAANLLFGAFDLGLTPSQRASAELLVIPLDTLEVCYQHFLPGLDREARRDPSVSPLYADLSGLPPAIFTVGTLDPLLDDSAFMASRWSAAGNIAELAIYPESVHGFTSFPTAMAVAARQRMHDFVRRHVVG
jgi:acetyl esterase